MLPDVNVQDAPPIVTDGEEAIEHAEGNRLHGKEVHGCNRFPMDSKEGQPALGPVRISRRSFHPTGDGSLVKIKTEYEEFPMYPRRDLTRYRRKLVECRPAERNRLLKVLETANIKLASVVSDVFGASGLLMVQALAEGKDTAQEMAQLAKKQLCKKIPELQLALEGKVEEHHRFLLSVQLHRLRAAEKDLVLIEQRIQEKLKPYAAEVTLWDEIPGVDATLAAAIIAELGVAMRVFENVSQLASWAGVCPGNNESAGKRRSSRIPKGNVYLKTALVEAANAAAKAKRHLPERQILPTQSSTRLQALQ